MARARRNESTPTLGLALIRFVTGLVLLHHGWLGASEARPGPEDIEQSVSASLGELGTVLSAWGELLLESPDGAAVLWRWGALILGLLFTLGALMRPAGAFAVLFLSHGLVYGPQEHELAFLLLLVSSLSCAASGAGRRMGLDALFDQHFPSWITWKKRPDSIFP